MLSSINLLGERARGNRWGVTALGYVAGSLLGGSMVGAVAASLGFLISRAVRPDRLALAVIVAGASLVAALFEMPVGPRLPTVRRQVNEDWLNRYRGWVYGAGFGFQLGAGVATIVTTATVYLTFGLSLLAGLAAGGIAPGVAVGATFGLLRAGPLLWSRGIASPAQLRAAQRRMAERAGRARGLTVVALGGAAAVTCAWLLL